MKKILITPLIIALGIAVIGSSNIFANEENLQNEVDVDQLIFSDEDNQNDSQLINEQKNIHVIENSSLDKKQSSTNKLAGSRALITALWGTAPVEFDDVTGILTIKAGTLSPRLSSEYIDTTNTIRKKDIKEIILENGVMAPVNSNYLFSGNNTNYWFNNLTSIQGALNTSLVTNMRNMFFHAESLTNLDVSTWDTSKVTDMSFTFFSSSSLTTLDVSEWNTSKVTTMQSMFGNGYGFVDLDVSKWNTSEVVNMSSLFAFTTNLPYLDVSEWDTGNVTAMSGTFSGTSSLTSLDVTNWNTSKVTTMSSMFSASGLPTLNLSNWDIGAVTTMQSMFSNTANLTSLNIRDWDTQNVSIMTSMFSFTKLREITLGDKSTFNTTTSLPAISIVSGAYSGKWERINPTTPPSIYNSSSDFMSSYDGSMSGTYAWQFASYMITYDLDGGTNALINPADYTYGVGVTNFANPTKEGHSFLGWVDASNNPITSISPTATGNKTLIATWEVATYAITYDLNGGINSDSNPTEYTYGIGITDFEEATRDGYTFLGWTDDSDNIITDISITETGNKVLTAKWIGNTYTIEYELGGGINSPNNPTEYIVGIGVEHFEDPTKEGYKFLGWYLESNTRNAPAEVTSISDSEFGDIILIAKWEKKLTASPIPPNNVVSNDSPKTGDNNTLSSMVLLLFGFVISGSYLIASKKERK